MNMDGAQVNSCSASAVLHGFCPFPSFSISLPVGEEHSQVQCIPAPRSCPATLPLAPAPSIWLPSEWVPSTTVAIAAKKRAATGWAGGGHTPCPSPLPTEMMKWFQGPTENVAEISRFTKDIHDRRAPFPKGNKHV